MGNCFKKSSSNKIERLQLTLEGIYKMCTTTSSARHVTHQNRHRGFKDLERFVKRADKKSFIHLNTKMLIWSILSCYLHFQLRPIKKLKIANINVKSKTNFLSLADNLYEKILKLIFPEKDSSAIEAVFNFIADNRLWRLEFFCIHVFAKLVNMQSLTEYIFNLIMEQIKKSLTDNLVESRQVVRIMYELLQIQTWTELEGDRKDCVYNMLQLYLQSNIQGNRFAALNKGLEVSARRLIEKVQNNDLHEIMETMIDWSLRDILHDDDVLNFGNVLEYAAAIYKVETFEWSIGSVLLASTLKMISSPKRVISHLGCKVLYQILDRSHNMYEYDTPKIFYQNSHFNILIPVYHSEDKNFLKRHRQIIHEAIHNACLAHGSEMRNLEGLYRIICILATEVPCGYTAAAVACLAMNIQESALHNTELEDIAQYHLHACVISLMTLICWIHKATDFYKYVNSILNKRAEVAPHLNPPIKSKYWFAMHHVLWNKPDLFFDDWEVRYGLWMTFKISKDE